MLGTEVSELSNRLKQSEVPAEVPEIKKKIKDLEKKMSTLLVKDYYDEREYDVKFFLR